MKMDESLPADSILMVDSTIALLVAQYCRISARKIEWLLLNAGAALTGEHRVPAQIPVAAANAIWREAIATCKDPTLPLRCAQLVPPGAARTIDMLLLYSPTLLQALENCKRTFSLMNEAFEFDIKREESRVLLSLFPVLDEDLMPNAYSEYVLLLLLLRCKASRRGQGFPLLEFHLRENSQEKSEAYAKEFRCTIRTNQAVHRMILPLEPLLARQPLADEGLTEVLMKYAHQLMQQRQEQMPLLIQLVAKVLESNLSEGGSKLGTIARKLAMSERTLQRALQLYGTTLRALHDEIRKRKFHSLVAQGMRNLDEISYALGFSDLRSFYRRVQVWTGTTPASYLSKIKNQK